MVRQRDDLNITVPSHFRCPISLDVMKSPVSLSTGVTYDRSSIQLWLDSGHDTCPSTMQVLPSKDLVPNLTLRRLILLWSDSYHPSPNPSSTPTAPSCDRDRARALAAFADLEGSRGDAEQLLAEIILFFEESEENQKFLAQEVGGFPETLLRFLRSPDTPVPTAELVVRILEVVLRRIEDHREGTVDSALRNDLRWLHAISAVLRRGLAKESMIAAVKIVEYCSTTAESKIAVMEKEGLLHEIINRLRQFPPDRHTDSSLAEACLSCLLALSPPKRVKTKLIDLNLIETLLKLLSIADLPAPVAEKVLRLLEAVTSCREGRSVLGGGECMGAVVQKLLKVSREATETAVRIMWAACWLLGEGGTREAIARSNGLGKVLLVMQSDCSPNVRRMCSDLVKVLRKCDGGCDGGDGNRWYSYDTKTTHIMPF